MNLGYLGLIEQKNYLIKTFPKNVYIYGKMTNIFWEGFSQNNLFFFLIFYVALHFGKYVACVKEEIKRLKLQHYEYPVFLPVA